MEPRYEIRSDGHTWIVFDKHSQLPILKSNVPTATYNEVVLLLNSLKKGNAGIRRTWRGIYIAIGNIVDSQRKRKKHFISFDDLYEKILKITDPNGQLRFKKNGVTIEKETVRQYCAPSQIVRQAKTQRSLKGIRSDREQGGLLF